MSHKARAALGMAALSVGALVAAAAPASAATGNLVLTIAPQSPTGASKTVTLTCGPTGGTHPDAEAACVDLKNAFGDINRIPPQTGVGCPAVFLPVTASASGSWDGRLVQYGKTFTNACAARVLTGGHVFNF